MPVAASRVRVTISRPSPSVRCLYPASIDAPVTSSGTISSAPSGCVEQAAGVRVPGHVEPAIGDEVAGEKVFDFVRSRRPLVADQPQSLRLREVLGLPGVEQIVDDGEQEFLGWIPRLREVVIEMR